MACAEAGHTEQLAQRLQSLPQELYDNIYNLTFQAVSHTDVSIDGAYNPPSTLQVDRRSRATFSKIYYSTVAFYAKYITALAKWLISVPKEHRKKLQCVTHLQRVFSTPRKAAKGNGFRAMRTVSLERYSVYNDLLGLGVDKDTARLVKRKDFTVEGDGSRVKRSYGIDL